MDRITDVEEAAMLVDLPIMDEHEMENISNHEWSLLGAFLSSNKEPKYTFSAPSQITLYSYDLDVRRWPTPIELDIIMSLEDNEDEEVICMMCNGSGEGRHDGSICSTCKGTGIENG